MKPTIGGIVHYFPLSFMPDGVTQIPGQGAAAIVVYVHTDGTVNLHIFSRCSADTFFAVRVPQGNGPEQWNWPPREAAS